MRKSLLKNKNKANKKKKKKKKERGRKRIGSCNMITDHIIMQIKFANLIFLQ
jgi:hypothetical protein